MEKSESIKTHPEINACHPPPTSIAGEVVSYGHKIPTGGPFEYLSCPHYFAEMLIYFAINLVQSGQSLTWWLVCAFVVINQLLMGLINHQWYRAEFRLYPSHRKAVIPFLI